MNRTTEQLQADPSDGALLARFITHRDQDAFAQLVRRHGGMVVGVCRSVLGNTPDAEDAAQAVFLTLAQRASSLQSCSTLVGWLHRVAWYVGARGAKAAAIRRRHEQEAVRMRKPLMQTTESDAPLDSLHAGLECLPEKYRVPLLLHHVEGHTLEETAALLGCNTSTASMRLTRGRQMLRDRLVKQGISMSAVGVTAVLAGQASATIAPTFVTSVSQLAVSVAAGNAAAAATSASITALSKGALNMLFWAKMKLAAMVAAAMLVGGGTAVLGIASTGLLARAVPPTAPPASGPSTPLAFTRPVATPSTPPFMQTAKDLTLDLGDKITMELVLIPAGKFTMGSAGSIWGGRSPDEVQHAVTISKPFHMGVTHVTVDQFAAFVKDSGYQTDAEKAGSSYGIEIKDGKLDLRRMNGCSWRNPSIAQKGDHPVVQISWNDANAFCTWLSKKSGRTVTLPTEGQWEYACRAGTKTAYPWGDNPKDGKGWANCADQSLKKMAPNVPDDMNRLFQWDDGYAFTAPVGSFKANAFGLFDMVGNALQWCQDRYAEYDATAATDPTGADSGNSRVLRGGSWWEGPAYVTSASRARNDAGDRYASALHGFRVVVTAAGQSLQAPSTPASPVVPEAEADRRRRGPDVPDPA